MCSTQFFSKNSTKVQNHVLLMSSHLAPTCLPNPAHYFLPLMFHQVIHSTFAVFFHNFYFTYFLCFYRVKYWLRRSILSMWHFVLISFVGLLTWPNEDDRKWLASLCWMCLKKMFLENKIYQSICQFHSRDKLIPGTRVRFKTHSGSYNKHRLSPPRSCGSSLEITFWWFQMACIFRSTCYMSRTRPNGRLT